MTVLDLEPCNATHFERVADSKYLRNNGFPKDAIPDEEGKRKEKHETEEEDDEVMSAPERTFKKMQALGFSDD